MGGGESAGETQIATNTMNNIDQLATALLNTWAKKTLEELRVEAERETSGIAFDAVRVNNKQRILVALCATDIDQIAMFEKAFRLVGSPPTSANWNTTTLAHVAMDAMRRGGFSFESRRDEFGRLSALALVAADPDSMRMMESVFKFPE